MELGGVLKVHKDQRAPSGLLAAQVPQALLVTQDQLVPRVTQEVLVQLVL